MEIGGSGVGARLGPKGAMLMNIFRGMVFFLLAAVKCNYDLMVGNKIAKSRLDEIIFHARGVL